MTFQPSAPHKRPRWLALLAIVMLASSLLTTSVLAAPTFTFVSDQDGQNDEPGQKDLTAQAAAFDGSTFYSAWKWDDTSWSGKNTGDACSLFDTDGDGNVNYAVCSTVGTASATELSTRVYSCTDGKPDRCTGPTLIGTEGVTTTNNWCTITNDAPGQFGDSSDTLAVCNISQVATDVGVSALNNATLLNSCSYPSQEPNSDPSDCVLIVANQDVVVSTQSGGTIAWQATLSDTATLNPSSATGSVVFKLYNDSACANLVWTSAADASAPFASGSGGSPADGNIITNLTVDSDGIYYWIATYTPSGAFNGDSSACGEATTITAGVAGNPGS